MKPVPWTAFFLVRGISANICQVSLKLNSIENGVKTKGVAKDAGLQRCGVVSLGEWILTCLRIVASSPSSVKQSGKIDDWLNTRL
jgi:hypothetical protein